MAPQQLKACGKVAFFERADDKIHGLNPAAEYSAFRILFATAASRTNDTEDSMIRLSLVLTAFGTAVAAQWLNYPAPGIPRLPDGKPNLSAPTPRSQDGKPDLSGIWVLDRPPLPQSAADPFGEAQIEIKPEDVILTPEGEALQRRRRNNFLGVRCLPRDLALYTGRRESCFACGVVELLLLA